jgi:hypothetical protein
MLEELGGLERKAANEEFEKRVENEGATLDVTLDRKKAGEHARERVRRVSIQVKSAYLIKGERLAPAAADELLGLEG